MQIGPYLLQDELGRGGAGSVVRAQNVATGQKVALKLLEARDARGRARFEREVAALRRLNHPGVVRLLDAGWVQDRPYLVMELIVGVSLQQHLDRRGALGSERVVEIADALAEALQHVHALGLLHRDLKPDNVLLTQDGRVVLADFGLVKDLTAESESEALSRTGVCMGTPGFWAPEQARGERERLSPATDVYGLGAVLYAALTRSPPFGGASLAEVLIATSDAPLIPPSERGAAVDPKLEAIVLRCLARDPSERFPSALTLRQALAGRGVEKKTRGPLLAAAALGLTSLGVGAALTLALLGPSPRPPVTGAASPPWTAASEGASPTPTTPPTPLDPALAKLLNTARAQTEAGEHRSALRTLDAAIAAHPTSIEALAARARAHRESGRPGPASRDLQDAIGLAPQDPALHYELGLVSTMQRLLQSAERCFDEAIRLDPKHWRAYCGRARVRGELDRFEEAFDDYRRSLEIQPDAETYARRADLLAHSGRLAEARADLDAAVALPRTDNSLLALYRRAQLRERNGDLHGAVADYTLGLAQNPRDTSLLGSRAAIHRQLGDLESALADLELLLELDPAHIAARINRSGIRGDVGDHAGAIADLDEVIRRAPQEPNGYYNRGYAHLIDLKDARTALPDLVHAVRLAPQDSDSHYTLGVAYLRLQREREGVLAFEEALRWNPKRYMAAKIRQKISEVLGRPSRY
mgnify:CR=1 FL=1